MGNLRVPLWVAGVLALLYGLVSLSPSLVSSVFDYEVKDLGLLAIVAGLFISLGLVTITVASNVEQYGGLAPIFALVQVIGLLVLVWQWAAGAFTPRNALASIILAAILAIWIWAARPKS